MVYEKGQHVEARWGGEWYPARIIEVIRTGYYKVMYVDDDYVMEMYAVDIQHETYSQRCVEDCNGSSRRKARSDRDQLPSNVSPRRKVNPIQRCIRERTQNIQAPGGLPQAMRQLGALAGQDEDDDNVTTAFNDNNSDNSLDIFDDDDAYWEDHGGCLNNVAPVLPPCTPLDNANVIKKNAARSKRQALAEIRPTDVLQRRQVRNKKNG
jgi:hypothetical protein